MADMYPPHRRRPLSDAKIEYSRGGYELGRDTDAQGMPFVGSFKKGGKVKRTGMAKVHKGEKVVPAKKVKQESRDKAMLQKTRFR